MVLVGGHEQQIGFSVIQTVVVDMVYYFVVWTVHNLSVHEDKEGFAMRGFFTKGIIYTAVLADVPSISGYTVVIFIID